MVERSSDLDHGMLVVRRHVIDQLSATTPNRSPCARRAPQVGELVDYNLSELLEHVTDTVEKRDAVVTPETRLTYADLDPQGGRAAGAHHLADTGIHAGDHVGVMLRNGAEHLEVMLGCLEFRAVPININYRYVAARARVPVRRRRSRRSRLPRMFAPAVADARDATPGFAPPARRRRRLECGRWFPGSVPYAEALAHCVARARLRGPIRRRRLLRVHRRHHRPAQGRALASRGHLFAAMGGGDPPGSAAADLGSRRAPGRIPTTGLGGGGHLAADARRGPVESVPGLCSAVGTVVLPAPGSLEAAELGGSSSESTRTS